MPAGAPVVYWFGAEDIDFTLTGGPSWVGSGYDGLWVRSGCSMSNASTTWPLIASINNPTSFGNQSSFWVHLACNFQTTANTLNAIWLALTDSSGVARILVRGTGTAGQVKISTRNAAGTITDLTGAVTASGAYAGVLTKIDLFVNYSASGQVQLYFGGALVADTGAGVNVTTDSATSLSFLYLSALSTNNGIVSQIIVADSDTRAAGVWVMNSSTAGNAQQWAGAAANVNEAILADASYITSASPGQIQEYKTGGIALPTGVFSVAAIKLVARALIGATGPQHLEYVTRVGSTDYVGGSWTPSGIGTFYTDTQNYMLPNNPATGVAWTTADLTATTFNYGVESLA